MAAAVHLPMPSTALVEQTMFTCDPGRVTGLHALPSCSLDQRIANQRLTWPSNVPVQVLQEYACRGGDRAPTLLALLRDGLMLQGGRVPPARRAGHLLGGPWHLLWGPGQRCPEPLGLHAGVAGLDNLHIHPAHLSRAELPICTTSWTLATPKHLTIFRYTAAQALRMSHNRNGISWTALAGDPLSQPSL